MAGLRNVVGRFVRQAVAAPGAVPEADEAITADELAAIEGPQDDVDPVQPATPANLHAMLAAARERRESLLRSGDVEAVLAVDAAIARLVVALESAQAQADRFYDEAPARERARAREVWARIEPRLQAVWDRRNAAALEIWRAIDACAAIECEAAALGFAVEITPTEGPVSRWMLTNWIAAHLQRQSQRAA